MKDLLLLEMVELFFFFFLSPFKWQQCGISVNWQVSVNTDFHLCSSHILCIAGLVTNGGHTQFVEEVLVTLHFLTFTVLSYC